MTYFPDPPSRDDELLSAYLDGETTAEETARVLGDPDLQARLRELGAAAALVSTPVEPAPAAARESAIGAALAAAEGGSDAAASEDDAVAPVAQLEHRRRRIWTVASAAAIALLVAVAVARTLQPGDTASTTALDQTDSKAAMSAPEGGAEEAATAGRAAAPSGGYLGDFASPSSLASAARAALDSPTGESTGAAGTTADRASPLVPAPASCPPTDSSHGAVVFDGAATLGGQPVRVIVQQDGTGAQLLSILDDGCQVVSTQAL